MKKINELFRLISARLSAGEQFTEHQQQEQHENPGSARSGPGRDEAPNRYIDRQTADAARKLWCSAGHF